MKKLLYLIAVIASISLTIKTQAALPITSEFFTQVEELQLKPNVSKEKMKDENKEDRVRTKNKKSKFKKLVKKGRHSKAVGALLAFFLGIFGVHLFYYGDNKGFLMLGVTLIGLAFILTAILLVGASMFGFTILAGVFAIAGYALLLFTSIWAFADFIQILIGRYPA